MATPGTPSATIPAAVLAAVLLLHVLLLAVPSAAQEEENQGSSIMYVYKGPSCSLPTPYMNCNTCYNAPSGSRGYYFAYRRKRGRGYTSPGCRGSYSTFTKDSSNCNSMPYKSFWMACTPGGAELDGFALEE